MICHGLSWIRDLDKVLSVGVGQQSAWEIVGDRLVDSVEKGSSVGELTVGPIPSNRSRGEMSYLVPLQLIVLTLQFTPIVEV